MKAKTLAFTLLLAVVSRAASGAESAAVPPRPCPAGMTTKATYAVLLLRNRAGALVVCGAKDGSETLLYAYNDRGRGPDTTTKLRLEAHGVPVSIETSGVDYLKSKIAERFTLAGGRATWENKAEKGGKAVAGTAYYPGYSSPPSDLATLAAALGKAKDGRLPLLPDGEARVEKRGEKTLTANGKTRTVVHQAVSGLGFTPAHVWLDADGAFFATVSSWSTIVREGWEPNVPELLKEQDADDDRRHAEQAKRLAKRPAGAVAFTNARLFDSLDAVVKPGTTVLVEGNRIAAVGPDGGVAIPEGAERIDVGGKTLMPGLWDMHVHVGPDDGLLHLAAGVTSVRDLANDDETVRGLEKKWDAGEALGPRLVRAGFIDGPGPYQGPTKALASTPEELRGFIRDYASKGYVQIKLYSSLKPELVTPAALEAHRLGMRLSGHIPAFMTAEQAVRAGYDEIQHINMLVLNFLDDVKDTRTPARFTAVAERAAELDLGSPRVKDFLALLKDRHTVVDPTLAIFENMFVDRPGTVSRAYEKVAHRFPAQVRRGFFDGGLPVPDGKDARYKDSFRACLKLTKALHDAGIPLVAGTDGLPGFQLPRDLELYAEAGIPPAEVLRMATLVAAAVAGKSPVLGSITPGKLADLLLVDGDPAARISDVRNVALVMKDGVMYDPAALSAALGMKAR